MAKRKRKAERRAYERGYKDGWKAGVWVGQRVIPKIPDRFRPYATTPLRPTDFRGSASHDHVSE